MRRFFSSAWMQKIFVAVLFGSSVLLGGVAALFLLMSPLEQELEQSLNRLLGDAVRVMAHQLETELTSLSEYFDQLAFKEVHIQTAPYQPVGDFIAESWVLGVQFFEKQLDVEDAKPVLRHTATNAESFFPVGLKDKLPQIFRDAAPLVEKAFLGESGLTKWTDVSNAPSAESLGLFSFPLKSPAKNYAAAAIIRLNRFKALMEQSLNMEGALVSEKGEVIIAAEPFFQDPSHEAFTEILHERFQHLIPESTLVKQHVLEDGGRVWIASSRIRESTIYGAFILRRASAFQEWLVLSQKLPLFAGALFLLGFVFGLLIPVTTRPKTLSINTAEFVTGAGPEASILTSSEPQVSDWSSKLPDQPLVEAKAPEEWYVQAEGQTLGPALPSFFAKCLYMQEISFEHSCWRVAGGEPVAIGASDMFEGSSEPDAIWWVFDEVTLHGPLTEGFLRTALMHGSLPETSWICRLSNLEGWVDAKSWLQNISQPQKGA